MRQKPIKISLLALIAIICVLPARAQETEDVMWTNGLKPHSWYVPLPGMKKELNDRWEEIGRDLETETDPLAGTFAEIGYEGGYMLRWSTKKGFLLVPYFDQSMIVDYSSGRVEITPDSEIRLIPEREMTGRGRVLKKTPLIWIPAVNGDYIVPKEDLGRFSNYYGGYGESNGFPRKFPCDGCGTFAKRQGGGALPRPSFVAPPKYVNAIKKPIEAKITFVGKNRRALSDQNTSWVTGEKELSSITPVLIDAGSRKGVRKGMFFLLEDGVGSNFYQVLEITRVMLRSSEGIVVRDLNDGKEMYHSHLYDDKSKEYLYLPFKPLVKGLKVTTSALGQ